MAVAEELIVQIRTDLDQAQRELKNLDKQINVLAVTSKKVGESFSKVGTTLTRSVTLPLAAAAGAAVKFAVDAQESINAVNVIFGESADVILAWGENAAEQAGLSQAEFNQASTVIGAALQNAGVAADDAAQSSIDLTKRAADMASVFNTDVDQALGAIQAALRGEIDPIERFGVGMNAAAVEAKALELGLVGVGQEMTTQAQTTARLAVIMEQTERVAGDFANTSDDLANNSRVLLAQLKDQAAEIGENLLPVVNRLVDVAGELIGRFSDLSEEQQNNILRLAGIAAAAGPAAKAIGSLSTAIGFLAANPIVLAIAGVAALAAGIVTLSRRARENQLQEIAERFADIDSLAGLAREEIEAIEDALRLGSMDQFIDAEEQTRALAENLDVSLIAVIDIAKNSEYVTQEYKDQLEPLETHIKRLESINDEIEERIRLAAIQDRVDRMSVSDLNDALAAARQVREEREAEAAAITETAAKERERLSIIADRLEREITGETEIEKLERERNELLDEAAKSYVKSGDEIERINSLYDTLIAKASDSTNEARRFAAFWTQAELNAAIETSRTQIGDMTTSLSIMNGVIGSTPTLAFDPEKVKESEKGVDDLNNTAKSLSDTIKGLIPVTGEFFDGVTIVAQGALLSYQALNEYLGGTFSSTLSAIGDLQDSRYNAEIKSLEMVRDTYEKNSAGYNRAQADINKAKAEQFRKDKRAAIGQALINGAVAITKAYAQLGPIFGSIAAGGIIGLTGVQVGAIASQEVPLAQGGVVTGPTRALIGEQGPEAVIPLNKMGGMGGSSTYVNAPQITVQGSMIHERQLIRYISGGQSKLGRGY